MRVYILYDARACGGRGTNGAAVLEMCFTMAAAREAEGDYGTMACYSYAMNGKPLEDEKWEWDYFENGENK